MKKSEIDAEAKKIINNLFEEVVRSDDKSLWKKAIHASKSREVVTGNHVWRRVSQILLDRFGRKFIKKI